MVGLVQTTFRNATNIRLDYTSFLGGFWVTHTDASGTAVVSRVELTSSPQGPLPITQQLGNGIQLPPTFRQKDWTVTQTYGGSDPNVPVNDRLSGNSIADVANQNGTAGPSILGHSSKGAIIGGTVPMVPAYIFVALRDVGKIDVFDVVGRIKVTTIDMPGVTRLTTYWNQ